ncbi:hypothetical protein [Wohlfahrtiimonas larvae]|uniref:Uncharacterized protein n=1 Tax=Wohlfahrtiimonas larvae TaxID=1157986 RepID=A0ABP9MMJ5_9GAMM|nr:hypothetical protein [Wohlfahrtiimonas larvae]
MEKIDDTKLISLGAFIVATIVLIIVALRDPTALSEIYWIYCLAFAGLKISKGIVTTLQKRDALINFKEQTNERNVDFGSDQPIGHQHSGSKLEAEKDGPTTGRSN